MGKIDELIKQFCPDGVKKVPIGDVLDYEQPSKYIVKSTEYDNSYNIPVLTAGKGFLLGYTNEQTGVYAASEENPTIIFDDFVTSFHWVDFPFKLKSSAMKMLTCKDKVNSFRFIYYAMCEIGFVAKEHSRHWISVYSKIEIPLPPLAIQKKIVEILDTFTGMIDNLQKELEQRQKQFEYYREILFAKRHSELKWEYIKNIALNCYAGATPSTKNKEYWEGGNIPWMSSGEVHQGQVLRVEGRITQKGYDHCSTKMVPRDSVVIALAGQGKTRGTVAITRIELCTNQSICAIVPDKTKVLPDYLYYYLKGQYFDLRRLSSGDGTRGGLNLKMINNYGIPIVSLGHQREIVEILDTFEALISNIKQEIELRQKQYEYYREKLLTFE